MPASMISAPTGGKPKVIGNSIAMAATVPMPGKTPTSVPTRAPSRQKEILNGFAATWNPIHRFERRSDIDVFTRSETRPKLERQIKQIDEQQDAEHGHRHRSDQAFDPPHLRRSENRDHEREECCGNQSERADHGGEGENGDDDETGTTNFVLFDRRPLGKDATERNR